jgi:hypothetical protein
VLELFIKLAMPLKIINIVSLYSAMQFQKVIKFVISARNGGIGAFIISIVF